MSWLKSNLGLGRKTIRGETLAFGDRTRVTTLAKSTFEHCDISLNCPARGLIIDRCIFRDCMIRAKKPQSDHQFFTSTFERCKFTGEFPGCEFGFRIDLHGNTRGTISDCDFQEAILDLVSFNNCDLNSLTLPRWPHFTIADPGTTSARIPNPLKCEELEALKATFQRHAPITKGVTCYAPYLLDETVYQEDRLRELLSSVAGIIL
jgi:hypothetical protein